MLTPQQKQSLEHGQAIDLMIDQTQCVVIRRDVYERALAAYDDSPWTDGELAEQASRTFDDADTAGPIE
jgi:hypothetical protein